MVTSPLWWAMETNTNFQDVEVWAEIPHFSNLIVLLAVWWCPSNRDLGVRLIDWLVCYKSCLNVTPQSKHSEGLSSMSRLAICRGQPVSHRQKAPPRDRKTRTSVPWQQPPFSMPPETIPLAPSFQSDTRIGIGWRRMALRKPSSLQLQSLLD